MTPCTIDVATRNDRVFETLEPYLVAAPWNSDHFDRRPFGLGVSDDNVIDPTRLASATFLERLSILDRLTFGPEGMPMQDWVFYDAAEVPGGIFGFATRAEALPPETAARLELAPGASGLVPLSMYIAMPARGEDTWFGHNLASLNPVVPELGLRGLASITKAAALKCFRCRTQIGATQWDSKALRIHTRFGPLELLTAWTPGHSEAATLTYRVEITDEKLRSALGDPGVRLERPVVDLVVASTDEPAMQALEARLEKGERFVIPDAPTHGGNETFHVPVSIVG